MLPLNEWHFYWGILCSWIQIEKKTRITNAKEKRKLECFSQCERIIWCEMIASKQVLSNSFLLFLLVVKLRCNTDIKLSSIDENVVLLWHLAGMNCCWWISYRIDDPKVWASCDFYRVWKIEFDDVSIFNTNFKISFISCSNNVLSSKRNKQVYIASTAKLMRSS